MKICKYLETMINKWFKSNFIFLLFVAVAFCQVHLLGTSNPFRYDWSWPIFDLRQFWSGLTGGSIQGIFSSLSRTGPAMFGLFGLINFPSVLLLKLFIFLVHFTAGYGFYRFIRNKVNSEVIAVISGLVYAFTPYIFIRTIVGFTWSMLAYAILPIFLAKFWQSNKKILDFLIIGFLFSLIFGQTQAGILVALIITIYLFVDLCSRLLCQLRNIGSARNDREELLIPIRNYFFTFVSLIIFALPWMIVMLVKKQPIATVSGSAATTLNFIASLPHSFRNMFMLSDHHITAGYFYPLSHDRYYLIVWLMVWAIAGCAIFNKKNRKLVLTFIISLLLVLPFIKGPTGIFRNFYIWFYNHFPQIAVFRETYHFEFLFAISLCILFALGLDWIWGRIDELKTKVERLKSKDSFQKLIGLLLTSLKAVLAASTVVIIYPYLTFNYAGYLKLQQIPQEYTDLYNYFQKNKDICHKIYYPPGLGFIYFKNDKSPGASNSDLIASSLGVPYLTDGASVLNLPTTEMFYRNELVSQFYEKRDSGQFISLLQEGSIDCVVVRTDLDTKYDQASNLGKETDQAIVSKWGNKDILGLTKSKEGLNEIKNFGDNIHIFKISNCSNYSNCSKQISSPNFENAKLDQTGKSTIDQFSQIRNSKFEILPLTDWATEFSYYKDGWSRGRYDFWRKHLFTELRQDFIYTNKQDSILSGKVAQSGSYDLWARYLTGGSVGTWDLEVGSSKFQAERDLGKEKFVWAKLGSLSVQKNDIIRINNIIGENAIADLILAKMN